MTEQRAECGRAGGGRAVERRADVVWSLLLYDAGSIVAPVTAADMTSYPALHPGLYGDHVTLHVDS